MLQFIKNTDRYTRGHTQQHTHTYSTVRKAIKHRAENSYWHLENRLHPATTFKKQKRSEKLSNGYSHLLQYFLHRELNQQLNAMPCWHSILEMHSYAVCAQDQLLMRCKKFMREFFYVLIRNDRGGVCVTHWLIPPIHSKCTINVHQKSTTNLSEANLKR